MQQQLGSDALAAGGRRAGGERDATARAWFDLSGTTSVVVGAGQGIGASIAVALARSGSRLVLAGRRLERLSDTRDRTESVGEVLGADEVDVSSPRSITDFAERVIDRHGPPTILVNSANVRLVAAALDTEVEDWDLTQHVHLRGPFLTSRAFAPAMMSANYGKIINLSSHWAVRVGQGRSAYGAAKAGLSQLTAALGVEWAPSGVRVNAIAPAATLTESMAARLGKDPARERYLRELIPLGRLATVDDIAPTAVYLASPASDFVTGHTLFIDGGASVATGPG